MYAIAIKHSNNSSWVMHSKVYEDKEKCEVCIEGMKIALKPYKIQIVFFDVDLT